MKSISKKTVVFFLAVLCLSAPLFAGGSGERAQASGGITRITMYPYDANLQSGVVGKWVGDYLRQNGVELEVWAYSDERTNAILASGDLPDVIHIADRNLSAMIEGNMLLKLDDYIDTIPNVVRFKDILTPAFNYIRQFKSAGTGSIYSMPVSVGDTSPGPMPETERNALRLNWPVYEQIGAPKFNDLYELIPIMKRMLAARPVGDNGSPTFGTVLNNGSDTEYWANIQMYYSFFGYQPYFMKYLLETDMVNNKINTILDKNSRYYEGLKWYYTLNREGLIDPDSINNDRPTQKAKVDAGNVMMPSGTNPGWTPIYFPYLMPGQKVYYSFSSPYGGNETIGISAKTTKLDACLKLLDIFAAPEFHTILRGGPEGRGEGWYTDERGNAFPTQRLLDFYKSQDQSSGFILSSGDRLELNFNSSVIVNTGILTKYGDSKGGYRPAFTNEWPEITEISLQNPVFKQWQKTTGHVNWQEWVNAENAWVKESPLNRLNTFTSTPDNIIQLTIDAIRDVVVNASWQMVYAKTDAEFENIWSKMVADCKGLGVDDLQKWAFVDIEKAKAVKASLEK